jgi:hypothetical protein
LAKPGVLLRLGQQTVNWNLKGAKKTNIFLIPPSYKKTPHECKDLKGCFEGGFFEGWAKALTD